MGNKIKGAFTVRFIRTGDQIYVSKSIVKFDNAGAESGGSLFQAIDPTNGTLSVNWKTDIYNQPALKVGIKSAIGNPVTITGIKWTYRGTELTFNTSAASTGNYTGWNLSTDGKFAKKEVDGYCYLRLIDNAASTTIISNQIIGYEISYISNNVRDSIAGTEDVLIQQAGLIEKASVIGRVGLIMLSCGTGAWRVRTSMNRLSKELGVTCTVDVGLMSIEFNCFDGKECVSQSLSIANTGVNTSKLYRMEQFVDSFPSREAHLTGEEIHKRLDEI